MTRVVVTDASCLIDLRKGRLLPAMLSLPYRFAVPLPLRKHELLDFTDDEWRLLDDGGMETFDLQPEQVSEAFALKRRHPRLSANDCFCLAAAQSCENSVLLTGDGILRRVAAQLKVCLHGVLWVVDECEKAGACSGNSLVAALETWRKDSSVFLPKAEIDRRLRRLR